MSRKICGIQEFRNKGEAGRKRGEMGNELGVLRETRQESAVQGSFGMVLWRHPRGQSAEETTDLHCLIPRRDGREDGEAASRGGWREAILRGPAMERVSS
jgi:hypothetical protein